MVPTNEDKFETTNSDLDKVYNIKQSCGQMFHHLCTLGVEKYDVGYPWFTQERLLEQKYL